MVSQVVWHRWRNCHALSFPVSRFSPVAGELTGRSRVFLFDKIFVAGVLIYIISPVDVFPEILLGPFGLIEDFILALIVLYRLLGNPYNTPGDSGTLERDPDIMAKIQRGLNILEGSGWGEDENVYEGDHRHHSCGNRSCGRGTPT